MAPQLSAKGCTKGCSQGLYTSKSPRGCWLWTGCSQAQVSWQQEGLCFF